MAYNVIDIGLRYASCVKQAKLLADIFESRCPQESIYILGRYLQDEAVMFVLKKVILYNLRGV